jgi:thiosulfate/3-mercaptopyruvate sulfurtransferase
MLFNALDAITTSQTSSVLFMDATFILPNSDRDAFSEYLEKHITGAVFFDINLVADKSSPLPHTMPNAAMFTDHMRLLGLNADHMVIIYDQSGMLSAARAWWMLRHFGHEHVAILDGGLPAWVAAGGAVETGVPSTPETGNFTAMAADPHDIMTREDMIALVAITLSDRSAQIVDARSAGRFTGKTAEPRPGMASGHMPGAVNCPISHLIDTDTGICKSPAQIETIFTAAGIDLNKPVVTSCGSGVTACGLAFGFALIGKHDVSIYDGSWSEWGATDADRLNCPVVTG